MKYDLVIFDLDGTLLDTVKDLGAAVNFALAKKGFSPHTDKQYMQMVGHGVRNLVTLALPEAFRIEPYIDDCLASFREYYSEHIAVYTKPYRGVHQLLKDLCAQGVLVAVASNKFHEGTSRLMEIFFPDVPFALVKGHVEGAPLKPDPAIVDSVLNELSSKREEVILREKVALVGDSSSDLKTALNASVTPISVTWGFRSRESLEASGAQNIASTMKELRNLLK